MKLFPFTVFLFTLVKMSNAQDSSMLTVPNSNPTQTIVYKKDLLIFEKPRLVRNIGKVPTDLWYITKAPFKKNNLMHLSLVAASTGILIWQDQNILHWVRHASDQIGLNPASDFKVLWKVGNTRILKAPGNLNTFFYQLGEGGTSLVLAGGFWVYGKIKKDLRALNSAADLAETYISMGVTSQIIKRITGRESPFVASFPGGRWQLFPSFYQYQNYTSTYDAFPSGHLATMMATVTVLSHNYPDKKWIKPVGYSIMGLSAWAMMNTEVHWAGDYPLAIAIGYLSGKVTTLRHQRKMINRKVVSL